ncbi:carcinoembryonic antigen-related cell adhesion molecule 6-like [Solea solea]|uniref:carcinoembryonic antigen-related cell adhesion molecule 6-like n=1 Tax=Solea solea TaxID=90069 RepID=UPI00272C28D2|nr:carcinoembryonic antigen-related cell adhesion molecule 6-like [Solea solea]
MDPLTLLLLMMITVIGRCAGQEILPEGPVDAVLGSDVVILTTLMNKPDYAFVIWNYNDGQDQTHVATVGSTGLKVNKPYEGRVSVNETNGYLSLRKLKREDSGDYSITIVSTDGATETAEIKLRVLEPVSNVVIKSNIPEAIEHNSTVVLTCSAGGSFLTFSWFHGDATLFADGKRINIKNEGTSSTLTIAAVLRSDLTAPVSCTAANKLEKEKSAPFKLTVHYGPDEVSLSPVKVPQFIRAGSNFNLSCSAPSSPPATFTWFHNQKVMEVAGPVLTLKVIQSHGLGKTMEEYTCRATNAKTQRIIASAGVSFAVMDAISGTKITGPTSILIAGNSSANLSCQATAGAVKTRTWLKDGKALSLSGRLVFSGDKSSLMINPLQKEDSGEYKCQLTNPVNSDEASFKMEVNFGPDPAAVAGEDAVEVNDKVTLTCSAMSVPPANFTWKFNGTVTDVKTAQYTIEKALYKNSGTYTCEAYNAITGKTSTSNHKLSVKEEGALDEGLSDGAIAGIVIAVLVALGAAIGLTMYCRQKVPVESPY